jgi:hypothetical protein
MVYIGQGEIAESTVPTTRKVPIERYKSRSNWLCAYRHMGNQLNSLSGRTTSQQASAIAMDAIRRQQSYNYIMTTLHGVRAFLWDSTAAVPNALLIDGRFEFVSQV